MMIADMEYLKLSLRKDRKIIVGLPVAFACTLPLALVWLKDGAQEAAQAGVSLVAFWAMFGLPIVGAVVGASSGAEARGDEEVEAALPLSPGRRALGRLASGLASLVLVGLVLFAAGAALSRFGPRRVPGFDVIEKLIVYAAYGALPAFAIAYATESSAIGACGGLLATMTMTILFGPLVLMDSVFSGRGPILSTMAGFLACAVAAPAASVALTARLRVWKRLSDGTHGLAQLLLLVSTGVCLYGLTGRFVGRFWRRPELFQGFIGTLRPSEDRWPLKVEPAVLAGGAYLSSLDGRVLWAANDGRLVEVAPPRVERGLIKALQDLPNAGGGELFLDRSGTARLLRHDGGRSYEIWTGAVGEALRLERTLPEDPGLTALVERPDGLYALSTYPRTRWARIRDDAPLSWAAFGRAVPWSWRELARTALPDGRSWPGLVRVDGGHYWSVELGRLVERELGGRLVGSWALPRWPRASGSRAHGPLPFAPSAEGLFVRTRSGLVLVGWDGRTLQRIGL